MPKIIHRLWVTVILEVSSRAVLGYYLSLGREVTKDDVLRAIKCALSTSSRPSISYSPVALMDEAGLPSSHHPEYIGMCWDETSVDGALAETCKPVATKLEAVVGSSLRSPTQGYSSRRSKDDPRSSSRSSERCPCEASGDCLIRPVANPQANRESTPTPSRKLRSFNCRISRNYWQHSSRTTTRRLTRDWVIDRRLRNSTITDPRACCRSAARIRCLCKAC